MRSTGANTRMSPGPFASGSTRPRRKMTPRSYSRRILIELSRYTMTITTMIVVKLVKSTISASCLVGNRFHCELELIDGRYFNARAGGCRPQRHCVPILAMHENLSLRAQRGDGRTRFADHALDAGLYFIAPRSQHQRDQEHRDD